MSFFIRFDRVSSRIQRECGRKETAKKGKEPVLRPILKSIVQTRFFSILVAQKTVLHVYR